MASRDWLLVLLGAVGFIVLSHQIPILRQLSVTSNKSSKVNSLYQSIEELKLEDILGIDLYSLEIARQKGLI